MATTYRDKLIADIDAIPKSQLPRLYAVVHTIKEQLLTSTPGKKGAEGVRQLGSAKGRVWIADDFNAPLPAEIFGDGLGLK